MEPVQLLIVMSGGVIQCIETCGVPIQVAVIEYDDSNDHDEETVQVPQSDGSTEPAHVALLDRKRGPDTPDVYKLFQFVKEEAQ